MFVSAVSRVMTGSVHFPRGQLYSTKTQHACVFVAEFLGQPDPVTI